MADTSKPGRPRKPTTRAVVKPVAKAAATRKPRVKAMPAPIAPEPAVLTAAQALNAAQAATGEVVKVRAKPGRKPKAAVSPDVPKPKPAAVKPAAPKSTPAPVSEAPKVAVPPVAKAAPEPKDAAPSDIPAVAALPVEQPQVAEAAVLTPPVEEPPVEQPAAIEPMPAAAAEAAPAPAVTEGTTGMTDVIETTKKITDEAKAKFESAFADFNAKAKAGVEKSTKALGELSDITKGNVEAFVESGKIAAKGVEAMSQDAAEYSRKNFEKATATMKSFAAIKSPTEFFQLQSELLSTAFDSFAKETAKSSEAMIKLAGDVAQPISTRVSLVTEKVKAMAA